LKTGKTVMKVSRSPEIHGVAGTAEFVGDHHVGIVIGGGQSQNHAATENERLRRGMGASKRLQALMFIGGQDNRWRKWNRHVGILTKTRDRPDRFAKLT